jgi:hypothetical protein
MEMFPYENAPARYWLVEMDEGQKIEESSGKDMHARRRMRSATSSNARAMSRKWMPAPTARSATAWASASTFGFAGSVFFFHKHHRFGFGTSCFCSSGLFLANVSRMVMISHPCVLLGGLRNQRSSETCAASVLLWFCFESSNGFFIEGR